MKANMTWLKSNLPYSAKEVRYENMMKTDIFMLKATVFYVYMERNRFFFKISTKKKQNKKM